MKAIVGLGNPGEKYRGTRHNIGFAVVDELARRAGAEFETAPADALIAKLRPASGGPPHVLLAKPMTFMNASGQAVGELLRYFKIEPVDLLVVVDEADLPLARLRARARGSAGGHNGLKSIIEQMGSEFSRLRVGVGRGMTEPGRATAGSLGSLSDHVLARFERNEEAEVERMTTRAADAAEMFIASGIAAVMNEYNSSGDSQIIE